ncbi:MAG: alpha/beta fold hydrolase [Myxococcales bacterium]|nr:alpha/beta fold hydrolase [Myxococcales bacterium]
MLRRAFALLGLAVAVLAACATAKKNQPMATLRHPAAPERADTLVVLLPGAGDSATTYDREGFIAAAREAGSAVDLVAVDAHAGYYFGRTLTDRLWEDVLAPARAEGYRQIWLVGISMGGLGALLTAQRHADAIDGVVLLAPYLGKRRTIEQIAAAGARAWEPAPEAGSYDYELWRWLKGYQDPGAARPALYLGYGTEDRGAGAHALLAELLPPEQTFTAPGGHDWPVWRPLWREILSSLAASSTWPPAPETPA